MNERKQNTSTQMQVMAFAKKNMGPELKRMLGGEPHNIADDSEFYRKLQQVLDKLGQPAQQASVFRGRVRSEGLRLINSSSEVRSRPCSIVERLHLLSITLGLDMPWPVLQKPAPSVCASMQSCCKFCLFSDAHRALARCRRCQLTRV
jgi:hypothetical protein